MIKQLYDYATHKFNNRIIMTILVKDEEDIIEDNIRFHKTLGIDAFIVMDNNSTDSTREILEKLSKEFEIIVINETGIYNQSKWMTRMAKLAKTRLNADWVISNDADEFWIPKNGKSLKEILSHKGNVITCHRYNMIIDENMEEGKYYTASYRVENPVFYSGKKQVDDGKISIPLTKISPKVIVNPNGLFKIRGGNHSAVHIGFPLSYFSRNYGKIKRNDDIYVYHFPIRSYKQFEANIKNRKYLLESGKKVKMGPHYKRWVRILNEGNLKKEYNENILFSGDDILTLEKFNIIKKDLSVNNIFENTIQRNDV